MKNNIDITDLFIKHSQNKLSNNELTRFNERLANDAAFRNAFYDFELTNNLLLNKELFEVNDILNELREKPVNLTKPSSTKSLLLGGSLVLVGLFAGAYYFSGGDDVQDETKQVFVQPLTTPVVIGNQNNALIEEKTHREEESTIKLAIEKEDSIVFVEVENETEFFIEPIEENLTEQPNKVLIEEGEEEKKVEQLVNESKKIIDYCTTPIEMEFVMTATCQEEALGVIDLRNVIGVNGTYELALNTANDFESIDEYTGLEAGTYRVFLRDEKGCQAMRVVTIEERFCMQKHFEIVLSYNEFWEIPLNENGKVKVFNRKGELVANFAIEENGENSWEGIGLDGRYLSSGLFSYVIETESGKSYLGSVSIFP